MFKLIVILLTAFLFVLFGSVSSIDEEEPQYGKYHNNSHYKLLKHLFADHDKRMVPATHADDDVLVEVTIRLDQLLDFDELDQVITARLYIYLQWKNPYMSWNYTEFGGLRMISVPSKEVWLPKLALIDSADLRKPLHIFDHDCDVIIDHFGIVSFENQPLILSGCDIDVTKFPFDSQTCLLRFKSLSSGLNTNMNLLFGDMQTTQSLKYMQNALWDMHQFSCETSKYRHIVKTLTKIDCKLHLHRKPLFYMFNLVMPCTVLMIIGGLCFCLPVESGEKVGLSVTVLLAITVFLGLVAEILPTNSDHVPDVAKFIAGSMSILGISSLMAVIVLGIHYQHENPFHRRTPPQWLVKFVLGPFAKVLLIDGKDLLKRYKAFKVKSKSKTKFNEKMDEKESDSLNNGCHKNDEDDDINTSIWFALAFVVDRLFFIIYSVICTGMVLTIVIQATKYNSYQSSNHP